MMNTGKEQYDHIPIPDEKLLTAIDIGIRRERFFRRWYFIMMVF